MEFKLIKKDYQSEYYEAKYNWKHITLTFTVSMRYHTILKFWTSRAYVTGLYFSTDIPGMIEDVDNRKHARSIAMEWIKELENHTEKYINSIDEFHQKSLLEDYNKKYSFK